MLITLSTTKTVSYFNARNDTFVIISTDQLTIRTLTEDFAMFTHFPALRLLMDYNKTLIAPMLVSEPNKDYYNWWPKTTEDGMKLW